MWFDFVGSGSHRGSGAEATAATQGATMQDVIFGFLSAPCGLGDGIAKRRLRLLSPMFRWEQPFICARYITYVSDVSGARKTKIHRQG